MKFIKLKLLASVFFVSFVFAQDEAVEEVVVTGSFIKGSATDGASPVEIVSRDTIEALGATTIADITANLSVNSGSENNSDSFTQGSTQGTSNVNLRGLGLTSTLVLIDGKRQALAANTANDGSVFVNTNGIPVVALERVEVLKEGAASIYGSDAIAGVVNYITRKDFTGFEVEMSSQEADLGGQTDDRVSLIWGTEMGDTNLVVALSQLDRSPLSGAANPKFVQTAISGFGNSFLILPPVAPTPENIGAYIAANGSTTTVDSGPYAGTYLLFENVPDANCVANGGQLQPQPTSAIGASGGTRCGFFYGDRFNIVNDEDHMSTYLSLSTSLNDMDFSVNYMSTEIDVNDNPQSPSYPALSYVSKLIMPGVAGNPFSLPIIWVGRPLGSAFESPNAPREYEVNRLSMSLSGTMDNGYDWEVSYTSSEDTSYGAQPDTSTSRFDAAINGVGGVSGTESWNLFDVSANSDSLINHIKANQETWMDSNLSVLDVVVTGSQNGYDFAGGFQYKEEEFEVRRDAGSIVEINGQGSLIQPADLMFLGGGLESSDSRDSIAFFAEVATNVNDKLELKGALRFEDLESDSTLNPKLSARYQAADNLILRGSVSTSFREPSLAQLSVTQVGLQGIVDAGSASQTFVRIAQANNPDLEPEEAVNMNFGAIWSPSDNLNVKLDYWNIDYSDLITVESAQGKVDADPNDPDVKRALDGTLIGVTTSYFNASEVKTDGLDLEVSYNFDTKYGQASLGLNRVHILSYEIPVNGESTDVVGQFNYNNFARSLPETKSVITGVLKNGDHTLSTFIRMVSDYETNRPLISLAQAMGYTQKIDDFVTVDFNYTYDTNWNNYDLKLSAGLKNAFDEEPPLVWDSINFSYDPKHHDARGRMVYVGFKLATN